MCGRNGLLSVESPHVCVCFSEVQQDFLNSLRIFPRIFLCLKAECEGKVFVQCLSSKRVYLVLPTQWEHLGDFQKAKVSVFIRHAAVIADESFVQDLENLYKCLNKWVKKHFTMTLSVGENSLGLYKDEVSERGARNVFYNFISSESVNIFCFATGR